MNIEHPLSHSEINHYTNYWCRKMGFKAKDLTTHPQWDDVSLLVNWTNEFWDCPKFWKKDIEKMWQWCYHNKLPLNKKHIKALTKITQGIIAWRNKRQQQITKIKAQRQNPKLKTTSS